MKTYQFKILGLLCALSVCTGAWAQTGDEQSAGDAELNKKIENVLAQLPKVSGYIQTGYNWGDANGDNRSSFQMKRMRLFLDRKLSKTFDVRAQFEIFSGSVDGTAYAKKVPTIMDIFVNAHVTKGLSLRIGQYYQPLGFENYDISPATLETVDFSNICYRVVCRNAVSTPNLIDYGRDVGVMAYGDLFPNKEKGFSYLSYNLSITNGHLPTLNDNNKSKDIAARLTIRPVKNLRLMGSYNHGKYRGVNDKEEVVDRLPMDRFIAGAWYLDPKGLLVRTEYARMKGAKANIEEEAFYVLAGYRIGKLIPVARWEMYRDKTHKASPVNRDNYLIGATYEASGSVKFQLNYIRSIYPDEVTAAKARTGAGNSLQAMCLLKF